MICQYRPPDVIALYFVFSKLTFRDKVKNVNNFERDQILNWNAAELFQYFSYRYLNDKRLLCHRTAKRRDKQSLWLIV